MRRKLTFRQKLLLNFSIIFAVFTVLVLIFQFEREKSFRRSNFEVTLDNIAELTHNYIQRKHIFEQGNYWLIDSLTALAPNLNIRITLIGRDGVVLYDSEVIDVRTMENHLDRPEVEAAFENGTGANIRKSATTGHSYYYYVKRYPKFFLRTAALYNVQVRERLHVERLFIAYLAMLFLVFSIVLIIITRRVSETITKLKDFAIGLRSGKDPSGGLQFPDDELGEISSQIISIYRELTKAQREIQADQDKLFNHLNALNEGIAFFTHEKKKILTNQQFIQNLNLVSGKSNVTPEEIFGLPEMAPVVDFVDRQLASVEPISPAYLPSLEKVMYRNNRYFTVKCMFFNDYSFEIAITDTTRLEKRKLIKQQMTSNIAHELKTPVTSILGYLETLQQEDVPEKTRKQFLKRALIQSERLSELIGDISSLNKIEEASDSFVKEPVRIRKIVDEVYQHLKLKLDTHRIRVHIRLPKDMVISGNISLLYSIFYNLFDNVIKYGGENIEINLESYLEDRKYYYYSFSNTGNPIEEIHLTRIFERFYRIDDGRSREQGGTGLGLSIVKNAIELHGGKITAKTHTKGGVEFLFSLQK
ncbi:MAG: HAMP domain-containing sensor histidine kinase [Bacteroidota bacterium]